MTLPSALPVPVADPLADSSLLDQEESSVCPPLCPSYRSHLTSLHSREYPAALETLEYLDPDCTGHALRAFRSCRTQAWFVRNRFTGQVQVHSRHCRNRLCPFCNAGKAARISTNVFAWIKTVDRPKLLTLTLKHSSAPLDQQVTALFAAFRKFRSLKPLRSTIRGGVWFLQVTLSPTDFTWHPHLHIILDADFVPQSQLVKHWLSVTHTSRILDVREIRSPEKAATYVSRYVSRPGAIHDWPVDYRAQMYNCLGSRRSCGCFGTARVFRVLAKPPYIRSDWEPVGSWATVTSLAPINPEAATILRAWQRGLPLAPAVSLAPVDHLIDGDSFGREPHPPPHTTELFDFDVSRDFYL